MIFLIILSISILVFILFPAQIVKGLVLLFGKLVFKTKIEGLKNIPHKGGGLIIANHVSYLDFILIACATKRMVRFVMNKDVYDKPGLKWLLKKLHMIPIYPRGGYNHLRIFNETCQREINDGHLVAIFAEGTVTRNGHLLGFKKGMEHIARGINAPIIPIHMEGVIGTPLSYSLYHNRFLPFKWSNLRQKIFITIGEPMSNTSSAFEVRQRIQEMGAESIYRRIDNNDTIANSILELKGDRLLYQDDENNILLAYELKNKAISLANSLRNELKEENNIGLILPNQGSKAVTVAALHLLEKTIVFLNQEDSKETHLSVLNATNTKVCIGDNVELNGIKVLNHSELPLHGSSKKSSVFPFKNGHQNKKSIAAIFSSVRNGEVKLQSMTHENLFALVYGIELIHNLEDYGMTYTMNPSSSPLNYITSYVLPICSSTSSALSDNPEKALNKSNTILGISDQIVDLYNNTELNEWKGIKYVISSEEALPINMLQQLNEKYNTQYFRGMGNNDIAPIISLNSPDFVGIDISGKKLKQEGQDNETVGRPIPGLAVKIVDQNNNSTLGVNELGKVFIKGAMITQNFLKETTTKCEEWIDAEILGRIDEKGFLRLE